MSDRSYLTVADDAVAEIEEKRSRFIAYVTRVGEEALARERVEELRKQHWDARHHCTAFRIGSRGDVERSNDDGEPAGTAGAPMLEVIRGAGVSDVLVVVVRYFGGTLLGAGGLVRAYSDATRAGLVAAGIRERRLLDLWTLSVEHGEAGRIQNAMRTRGVQVRDVEYAEQAHLSLAAEDLDLTSFGAVRAGEEWADC
ncbi:MAG: YigZ family protein [Nocardioidaceae bacterium]|nr:MAG: YigZ family protein [Nocardioidaceae bacterium]